MEQNVPTMCDFWIVVNDDSDGLSLLMAWSDKFDVALIDKFARGFNEMLKILVR